MPKPSFPVRDLALAWLVATVFSGAPSTLLALATGGDPAEATFAAGRMLVDSASPVVLFAAAALVHPAVSALWTLVAALALSARHITVKAMAFSAGVGLLDLLLIAPRWFPEVAALAFWPQMADHLMWGACLGGTLHALASRRARHHARHG
jgi:hypothetical protein